MSDRGVPRDAWLLLGAVVLGFVAGVASLPAVVWINTRQTIAQCLGWLP